MPLSDLIIVLCPTLKINLPTLRVLCEAESIWKGLAEGWEDIGLGPKRDYPISMPDNLASNRSRISLPNLVFRKVTRMIRVLLCNQLVSGIPG